MSEIDRIAALLKQTFEGKPYYGPSVLGALEGIPAEIAIQQPPWSPHSIWSIVTHLTAELIYARQVIEGIAAPYDEKTWFEVVDASEVAWQQALKDLKRANHLLLRAVKQLDDSILDEKPVRVRGPYYLMLHGTIQHNIYHAGQISLLSGQKATR